MNETGLRRTLPDQTSGSGQTFDTSHHPSITNTTLSKRVCFYKSGDPQFSGLRVVINNRTFKTFDALLDSLSKKVPLPFGVRNITTPRGIHGINTLDELEDGKSYICSDTRKVKPVDLALARRRLPPWYHVRPVSSHRSTARFFPGRKNIHRDSTGVIRTPKKLVVFRNGDPSIWHIVVLHKKTTPNYESILGHISELMQFHVIKLHTPDGRRIDGLPGLILCSGSVVAVGREPFRPAVYGADKSPSPTRQPTKQRAYKRQKTSVCKYKRKSRNFSTSSERYIVHQIHNSVGESSCDLPTNSIESGSDRILESLAETEEETCLGNRNGEEGQDSVLPSDDNIEKSFRVNQDGSMTVEMKVRLTIKEEETVQWTTTLTRSVVADQADVACLPDPEQEVCSNHSQTSATSTDIIYKDRTREDNDDDPPSLGNGAVSDTFQEEDDHKEHNGSLPLSRRVPTPGCKKISKLRASVESIKSVTVDEIGEGKIGSYIIREETENRTTTEQFYMENQNRTKPVPKPRRHGSVDVNSRDISAFKSTEIMQTESSGEEVTEAVLHIYEQQTYHDNFLANVGVHGMSASGATSETRQLCSSNEFEPSPSPAFEPVSTYRTDSRSVASDLHLASLKAGAVQGAKTETLQQFTKSHNKPGEKEVRKDLRVFSKPKLVGKHVRLVMTPGKRQMKSSTKAAEKHKTVKPFSSALFIKKIYGAKTKTTKHIKRRATPTWNNLPKPNAKNVNFQLSLKEKNKQMLFNTQTETSHPQGELSKNQYLNINKGVPLQSFYPSSSIAKEYVENWLEKAHSNPSSNQDKLPPPPPDLLNADDFTNDAISITSSPMSSQRSHIYSLSSSPTSDEVISPDDTTLEKSSSQSKNQQGAELSRTPSIKRAPLNNGNEGSKALPTPISTTGNEICSTGTTQQVEVTSEETKQPILEVGTPSFCTSVSPLSLTSDGRMSSSSVVSSETSAVGNILFHTTKLETQSPKSLMKTAKLKSSPSPERKFHNKKSSELQNTSPKLSPMTRRLLDKQVLSNKGPQKHEAPNSSPLTGRKHHETKALQRTSLWSKSLDMVSPPGRQKLSKKPLPRNLSVDSPSEPNKKKPNKTSSQIESHQTAQMEGDQVIPESNMKPVLEKICYSIKSIRQMTKNKRPSCLEKSNSLPDFSSHVASTFGSSSKVLLAFLAVMTLKEGLTNLNMKELNANNVSCAEALKMIDSLKEIANIEDSQRLRTSLSDLQQSASTQLLQSWRGFQELGDRSKTRSVTPHTSEAGLGTIVIPELDCGIGENVINEIIENLDIPQKLKEELVSLSEGAEVDGGHGGSMPSATPRLLADQSNHEDTQNISNDECVAQDDKQNANVRSTVQTITNINQPKQPEMDRAAVLSEAAKYKPLGQAAEDNGCQDWSNSVSNTKNVPQENNICRTTSPNLQSSPDEETQKIPSANQDYCEQGAEKRAEVTHPGIKQEISASSNLGNLPVEKQPSSNYYVEVDVKGNKAILNTGGEKLQEEDSTETKRLSLSTDDSIGSSDVEETCSEEEQPEVDCKKLQVIFEESLSGNEEEEEESLPKFAEQIKKGRELEALTEEPEEDQVSSEDEAQYNEEPERHISPEGGSIDLLENSDVFSKNEDSRFNVDDSGNDDSTFEEHVDEVQPNDEDKQKRSLVEKNLSYYEQDCSSEQEQASKVGNFKESYAQNQEIPLRAQLEESNEEAVVENPKQQSEEVTTQSVAERVTLLEKQVAEAQKSQLAPKSSTIRRFSQRKSSPESGDFPSEPTTSELALCTRSAPQSSLSFSYDSSGVITTEPEGSRVRSIREMFLARSGKDIQQKGFLSPNVSELRGETSDSGGYQSQTSSDLSGPEDDSAQKSISKGFVRRAIEMLYGKKDLEPEEASERPLSEPDQTKRETSSIFSPFHAARSKAMSELSYFNSSTALDIFSEATKCIAFNAQVGPGDSVPIDNGRWLLRENTSMRKSVSDPAGINKTFTNTFHLDELHKDAEEKTPYSLFSAKPELEDETKSQPGKCTYFSLPYASESEVCQEEMSTVSKGSKAEDSDEETKDASENSKTWAERNGTLPGIGVADFKMKDNKVHPLVELPSDGEVVVVQPGKGQVVNRRIQERDVLDLLYSFCGEHCPIL
uniref:Doublecortin domain-containing protein n=1 Tax=Poecilia formosa TaxID=48698 RepID=A0A087Y771_POEFO